MKEKYQVFARKYRPQTFKDVFGQDSIITTLKNSLRLNKTAQAYLFSGSRGTGKTTLTRLFAKALNCQNLVDGEPCNKCPSCLEITSSSSLDVIEIDGASNRGIDDIRQINETIGYSPSNGKYKIYIIDEVHMLTKEAFNALLKTLEEPPATVKFFFATTEPHKVLPTIISRCQRFDLKRINSNLIIQKLKSIAQDESRTLSEEAFHLIARFADGSLRDAESLLDQVLCYSPDNIDTPVINQILGLIPQDYFFKLDLAVSNEDINVAFELTDMLYTSGKDFSFFVEELLEHFRKILILKLKPSQDLYLSSSLQSKYLESSSHYSVDQCLFILDNLLSAFQQMQKSSSKQYFLEMILVQIIRSKNRISLPALIQRLSQLEKKHPEAQKPEEQASPEKPLEEPPLNKVLEEPALKTSLKETLEKIIPEAQNNAPDLNLSNAAASSIEPEIPKERDPTAPEVLQQNRKSLKSQESYYDTLLHFAAVELNGIVKKE